MKSFVNPKHLKGRTKYPKIEGHYFYIMPVNTRMECATGHRFVPSHFPRHVNCHNCWRAFFLHNPSEFIATQSMVKSFGTTPVRNKKGKKYVKNFLKFEATLEKVKEARANG